MAAYTVCVDTAIPRDLTRLLNIFRERHERSTLVDDWASDYVATVATVGPGAEIEVAAAKDAPGVNVWGLKPYKNGKVPLLRSGWTQINPVRHSVKHIQQGTRASAGLSISERREAAVDIRRNTPIPSPAGLPLAIIADTSLSKYSYSRGEQREHVALLSEAATKGDWHTLAMMCPAKAFGHPRRYVGFDVPAISPLATCRPADPTLPLYNSETYPGGVECPRVPSDPCSYFRPVFFNGIDIIPHSTMLEWVFTTDDPDYAGSRMYLRKFSVGTNAGSYYVQRDVDGALKGRYMVYSFTYRYGIPTIEIKSVISSKGAITVYIVPKSTAVIYDLQERKNHFDTMCNERSLLLQNMRFSWGEEKLHRYISRARRPATVDGSSAHNVLLLDNGYTDNDRLRFDFEVGIDHAGNTVTRPEMHCHADITAALFALSESKSASGSHLPREIIKAILDFV